MVSREVRVWDEDGGEYTEILQLVEAMAVAMVVVVLALVMADVVVSVVMLMLFMVFEG